MNVIWKFPLKLDAYQEVSMPTGATVLHVDAQDSTPCIWALVDPKAPLVSRRILLAVTGTSPEGPEVSEYLGTFLLHGGAFVGHVFDCGAAS